MPYPTEELICFAFSWHILDGSREEQAPPLLVVICFAVGDVYRIGFTISDVHALTVSRLLIG